MEGGGQFVSDKIYHTRTSNNTCNTTAVFSTIPANRTYNVSLEWVPTSEVRTQYDVGGTDLIAVQEFRKLFDIHLHFCHFLNVVSRRTSTLFPKKLAECINLNLVPICGWCRFV